ncbi:hypothetical protein DBV14_07365 [Variovorax sp. KBW07]|uniref:sensor histidine kinase n=1 Tax=Variovorax sp. KBW07 TaxID=2153358 RepID=UPI000F5781B4|nr:sensor histidine kinase [Variovorax sp. KBW07]RQO59413.1 hypothetical protein DBV14_07365 [Variovorax sp. KBW07]
MAKRPTQDAPTGGVRRETAIFSFSAAHLEELGERLVSKPEVALAELIKNSYDADAHTCDIELDGETIVVRDDGHGMTEQQFLSNWMVVSTQNKGAQRLSRKYKRSMAGSKGIGRFSARFLGRHVVLESTCEDLASGVRTLLRATFNWDKFTQQRAIESVEIPYSVQIVGHDAKAGTTLTITKLRREAVEISAAVVKSDILRLTSPILGLEPAPFHPIEESTDVNPDRDPGFSVNFPSKEGEDAATTLAPNVQETIMGAFVGRVRIYVDETGKLDYRVFWHGSKTPMKKGTFNIAKFCSPFTPDRARASGEEEADIRGLRLEFEDFQQLPLAEHVNSPIFIDLRFFPKRKGTFSGHGLNGIVAQRWIRDHAGYAIADNRFVMHDYDSGSDWLGIDASKATNQRDWQSIFMPILFPMLATDKADPGRNPMLALPRGTQLIGRVHIATHKRPTQDDEDSEEWLQPNMDRESLRDNGAYRTLWHVSRFAAELIAHFDRADRLTQEEQKNEEAAQEANNALTRAISEIRSSKGIEPEYRAQIVQQLKIAQARYAETSEYNKEARESLELMSMMGIMAGFMTHEFEKAVSTLSEAARVIKALANRDPRLAGTATKLSSMESTLAHYMDYMRVFIGRARQPRAQSFKSNAQVQFIVNTLDSISQTHNVDVKVDIDPSLPGPVIPIAAYHGVVVNLISNALKALVPKISKEPRKVRVYATNEGTKHVLVCADNGIGIPDYLRDRIWDPLYSTSAGADEDNPLASGLGLGLSLVQQVVKKMKGKIELLDEPPPGFVTAFRVTFPLNEE